MGTGFKRAVLINSAIILAVIAGFVVAFRVTGGKLAAETVKIAADRAAINQSTGAAEKLAALKNTEPTADLYARAVNLLLPSQEELLNLPRDVEDIGRLHQVGALFTFQNGGDTTTPGGTTLPFSITANGSANNLIAFLKELEVKHPKYTLAFDSMDITGNSTTTQQLLAVGRVFFKP